MVEVYLSAKQGAVLEEEAALKGAKVQVLAGLLW